MDAAKSSLQSRNSDLNQVAIEKVGLKSTFDPESRAKIHFRSILWGRNPFPIHFMGLKSISDPFYGVKIHFLI